MITLSKMDELYKFIIDSAKKIAQKINIRDQIKDWKRLNDDKEPEILIDLDEFRNVFAQRDEAGILLGGRYQIYNILFERFVKELLVNKVKLTFFAAARHTTDELYLFIPKMEHDYYKHILLMDKWTSAANINQIKGNRNSTIPVTIEHNLIALIKKFCPKNSLHMNYYRHTQEIAKYARENVNHVLAIISNNLDLLLFEGSYQFWYANNIDFRVFTTLRFCRTTLETSVGLNTKQLQLLTVLMGSPYVPAEIMDEFLPKIPNRILILISYIRKNSTESAFELEQIAKDIFAPNDDTQFGINAIENGLNCFDTRISIATPNDNPFSSFSKERNAFIYQLIVDDVYLIKDVIYLDYRNSRAAKLPDLIIPLIQKMMGILYKMNSIKPMDRKICIKVAHDEPWRIIKIPVIYPTVSMPQLFVLIYKNREFQYDNVRWSLLAWIFDLRDEFCKNLRNLSQANTSTVLTLQYLIQNGMISHLEADAILYSEYESRARAEGVLPSAIPYPNSIDTEYVQIAHLYTKMFVMINRCLELCGLSRRKDIIQFDGPLFYVRLHEFTNLKVAELNEKLSQIDSIRIYS